jgi:hypothetical protein
VSLILYDRAGGVFGLRCGVGGKLAAILWSLRSGREPAFYTVADRSGHDAEVQGPLEGAAGSAAVAQQLADRFIKFLVEMGCEDSQASLYSATLTDVVWFFQGPPTTQNEHWRGAVHGLLGCSDLVAPT